MIKRTPSLKNKLFYSKIATWRVCCLSWVLVPPEATRRDTRQNKGYLMNNRLLDIIKYKTGGRQKAFAELIGWTPQYLAKLLRGDNFGLQPVLTLLEKLPEINARWLLLGQGEMLEKGKLFKLRHEAFAQAQSILDLERFIPFMLPDELREFEEAVAESRVPVFNPARIASWDRELKEHNAKLDERFKDAIAKSVTACKHPKVKQS